MYTVCWLRSFRVYRRVISLSTIDVGGSSCYVNKTHQTNNGPEAFHSKLNSHLHASHPNIFLFFDVIKKMQATTYIKIRAIDSIFAPRKCEAEKLQFCVEQYIAFSAGEKN